jgi:hypothetical protein
MSDFFRVFKKKPLVKQPEMYFCFYEILIIIWTYLSFRIELYMQIKMYVTKNKC